MSSKKKPVATPKRVPKKSSKKAQSPPHCEGIKYLSEVFGELWEFLGIRIGRCYHDMSDLSDSTVSDVGGSDSDHSSDNPFDNPFDDSDDPVQIKDGLITYFIKDSSGNLKTCSLCKCVSVYGLLYIRVIAHVYGIVG